MGTFKLCTFNCENLFARYRFRENFTGDPEQGWTINDSTFDIYDETEKQITAKAIRAVDPDIVCVQEVENLPTLERFASRYLAPCKYKYRLLIDAHDPRNIDVGVLSRFPITSVMTYRDLRTKNNKAYVYSRDCLQVTFEVTDGVEFTVYVNHFKSMMGGRAKTHDRRKQQADEVAHLLKKQWGSDMKGNFAVVGDFNDYLGDGTALNGLVKSPLVNIMERVSEHDRWTHYYARDEEYRQLDYILLPKDLDDAQGNPVPGVERRGMPFRAERVTEQRFEFVGESAPKASDHCPLYVEMDTDKVV